MHAYGITHIGKVRKNNEDAYLILNHPIGDYDNLFVVADGMGGHAAGEIASITAIEAVREVFLNAKKFSPLYDLEKAMNEANRQVFEKNWKYEEYKGMGTTLIVATIKDNILWIAHAGDSRMYSFSGKKIKQLTKDHSYVQELVDAGIITHEEAEHHPHKNRITRAIGVSKEIQMDLLKIPLLEEEILLMCTDGLSGMLNDISLEKTLEETIGLEEKGEKLLEKALNQGGTDNITFILIERDCKR